MIGLFEDQFFNISVLSLSFMKFAPDIFFKTEAMEKQQK